VSSPRLGRVSFINCNPLYDGLENGPYQTSAVIKAHPPSQLNRMLVEGELDITPVSSIAYARHKEICVALPDLSISADGEVMSVLLVSKIPITKLGGQTIALTPYSATSIVLLKILLQKYLGLSATYVARKAGQDPLADAAAGLIIGDEALLYRPQPGYYVYDLAAEWKKHTGHAMVFALWVARREFAGAHPDHVSAILSDITNSRSWGESHQTQVIRRAQQDTGLGYHLLERYFKLLQFNLTARHQAGLLHFYRSAWEIGLLPEPVNLEIWREPGVPLYTQQSHRRRAAYS